MNRCLGFVVTVVTVLGFAPVARGAPPPDRIVFDGASLVWVSATGSTSYAGFSGRAAGSANEADDDGPVPQGRYSLDPANVQDLSSQPAGVLRTWGNARIPLQPRKSTRRRMRDGLKADRRGFFVHGGTERRTSFSIEISDAAALASFLRRLKDYGKPIDVEVAYAGEWEARFELPTCRYPPAEAPPGSPNEADDPVESVWSCALDSPWEDRTTALVLDAYWMNAIDWERLATDPRVAGIIHKATQGMVVDRLHDAQRFEARRRGYLWGSYHLAMPGDPIGQADCYVDTVRPEPDEVIALDLEGLDPEKFMSLDDAVRCIERMYARTGRYPLVYANSAVVRAIAKTYGADSVFARCPLWIARPGPVLDGLPNGVWQTYALWQFSSEMNCKPAGKGACFYRVPGTAFDMDVNVFPGTVDELRVRWKEWTGLQDFQD